MNLLFNNELSKVDNLLQRFEEIHNYVYANDGLAPAQVLEEMLKILFIKIEDENINANAFNISQNELAEIKTNGNSKQFISRINDIFTKTKSTYYQVFTKDEKLNLTANSLAFTVNKLQGISLTNSSNDAKGLAFQKFLTHQDKDGRGQFFTPEPIIDFCVNIIQPQPHETVIDPCCGSGGFLFSAYNYVRSQHPKTNITKYISNNLFGTDINKSVARIAKMKLILEHNGNINILCQNALEDLDEINLAFRTNTNAKAAANNFDIVLTNPPFGTLGKITNAKQLAQFDLGYKWNKSETDYYKSKTLSTGQAAEVLFMERCLQLLKEGGRMAIVLPNGHFENSSLEYLRYYIKQKAKLLAIVNLPQETFIPFGTGVKTSLMFLQKETANTQKQYPIFFGRVTKLGYQGNKNGLPIYKKDKFGINIKDENKNLILDEDFTNVVADYKQYQQTNSVQTANSFAINFNELNGRFDYDFYSPENRNLINILNNKNAVPLASLVEVVKTKSKLLNNASKQVEYVELSDINTHSFEIINSTTHQVHELPSRASYELKEGDIITAVAGNSIGTAKHATALVTAEYSKAICTNGFRVLRNFKIDPYYLLYFFKSDSFLKQIFMYRTGAAIPSIADTDFGNILIHLPNEKTIKEISRKVKNSFDLRAKSRLELESIEEEYATV